MKSNRSRALDHVRRYPMYLGMLVSAVASPLVGFVVLAGNALWLSVSYAFLHFERGINPHVNHFGDALWWGLSTLTTVGFGDIVPLTGAGRVLGGILMLSGNFFFVSFSGLLFSIFFAHAEQEVLRGQRVTIDEHRQLLHEVRALREELSRKKP